MDWERFDSTDTRRKENRACINESWRYRNADRNRRSADSWRRTTVIKENGRRSSPFSSPVDEPQASHTSDSAQRRRWASGNSLDTTLTGTCVNRPTAEQQPRSAVLNARSVGRSHRGRTGSSSSLAWEKPDGLERRLVFARSMVFGAKSRRINNRGDGDDEKSINTHERSITPRYRVYHYYRVTCVGHICVCVLQNN